MAKRGRPLKYTLDKLEDIKSKLELYIDKTDIPIIAEFAYKNKIPRAKLYEFEELNYTIKRLIDKKEAQLERLALNKEINHTMAIFSLKQLGWKDDVSSSESQSMPEIVINVRDN